MTDQRWTDTPIDPGAYWHHEADLLRAHPGRWRDVKQCRSATTAKSTARDIREGRITAFRPAGAFDAVSRGEIVKAVYVATTAPGDTP